MIVVAFSARTRGKQIQVHATVDPDAVQAHAGPVDPETDILQSEPGSRVFKALCGRGLDWYQIFDPANPELSWEARVLRADRVNDFGDLCQRCVLAHYLMET